MLNKSSARVLSVKILNIYVCCFIQYRFDEQTGAWTHRSGFKKVGPGFESLHDISYTRGFFQSRNAADDDTSSLPERSPAGNELSSCLNDARNLFEGARKLKIVST